MQVTLRRQQLRMARELADRFEVRPAAHQRSQKNNDASSRELSAQRLGHDLGKRRTDRHDPFVAGFRRDGLVFLRAPIGP